MDKKVFEIADKLGKEEILCQLSEECAELIQSCLKYRRTTKGLTPKSEEEVRENLFEELSDVLMNIEQIKYLFNKELSDTAVENVIEKWDADYILPIPKEECVSIINAANYMDIPSLLQLACAKIAALMMDLPVEEIQKEFGIENDMTEEEAAEYDKYPIV